MSKGEIADDLLSGAEEIALAVWGVVNSKTKRRVYAAAEAGDLPIFKIGAILHARRSSLNEAIARMEREAMAKSAEAA